MEEVVVLIVGAGPAGLATTACLSQFSIPYVIVERENCSASLWRNRAYDRFKLHLAKEFCELPHMSYPVDAPTYIPNNQFVKYLDDYIEHFNIQPKYLTAVESSTYDIDGKCWCIMARDMTSCMVVNYMARFLVVASGENSAANIPMFLGQQTFPNVSIHSSKIAYDLVTHGANTFLVIRSSIHVMTKELIRLGMTLVRHLPPKWVDHLLMMMADFVFGDLSKYGIMRPKKDPLVQGMVTKIKGKTIEFQGGNEASFDAIVFATGYKSTSNTWLKNGESMLNDNGLPNKEFPNHWK
ncbi:hypothetical protein BRADI_1g12306v3, partial [Brachypodium distachyon]